MNHRLFIRHLNALFDEWFELCMGLGDLFLVHSQYLRRRWRCRNIGRLDHHRRLRRGGKHLRPCRGLRKLEYRDIHRWLRHRWHDCVSNGLLEFYVQRFDFEIHFK